MPYAADHRAARAKGIRHRVGESIFDREVKIGNEGATLPF